ncbi:MAG: histidinol-phosphate transaminase [Oscillospiraceae bacterium]|nr:histidinol-phosphate transaminase [Oscillospiraceae bacterium]
MSRFLSQRLLSLDAYVPGEQPTDMEFIKLNTNESPYPPPPGVVSAINAEEIEKLRLYPSPDGNILIDKLAKFYGVNTDNIIIGNGSDELLAFAFLAFCDKTRHICFPDITYGFYPVYAELYDLPYEQIPLKEDFTIGVSDYFGVGKNIIIANPNAPTGIALKLIEIESILKTNPDHVVLIDEAYVDFGADSAIPLIKKYDNLIVMHTYSKARSMAGARLAYAIASAALIEDLNRMKYSFNPYNVNRLTQVAGIAALDNDDYYKEKQREIIETREDAKSRLRDLGFIMTDSMANFLFTMHPDVSGADLYAALRSRGILVRHWNKARISDYLRITVGTKEQMDLLIAAMSDILSQTHK